MADREKIGVRVDADLWERFRRNVEARKGQVRGVLGDELENAIRQYLSDGPDPTEKRILEKLTRIEDGVGVSPADGGVDTFGPEPHTHAPSRLQVSDKPPSNAATDKKVAYLADCLLDEEVPHTRELDSVTRDGIREVVKEEYGFRADTARRYVSELISHFDLVEHPNADDVLVTTDKRDELEAAIQEGTRDDADARLDELTTDANHEPHRQ